MGGVDIGALAALLWEVRPYLPEQTTSSVSSPLWRLDTAYAVLNSVAKAGGALVVTAPADVPSQEEVDTVVAGIQRYGGGFATALGRALQLADSDNRRRIRTAFPELWTKYQGLGTLAIEADKRVAEEAGK